jgi:hypothetical protein
MDSPTFEALKRIMELIEPRSGAPAELREDWHRVAAWSAWSPERGRFPRVFVDVFTINSTTSASSPHPELLAHGRFQAFEEPAHPCNRSQQFSPSCARCTRE